MGKFSRADEDWQGCESGADYFFAHIYSPEESAEEEKKEAIRKYVKALEDNRRRRFKFRYSFDEREYSHTLVENQRERFYRQLDLLLPKKFRSPDKPLMRLGEFYPDRKHKFSVDLYEKGFSHLEGYAYWMSQNYDPCDSNVIVQVPDTCGWVKIHAVFRKHPCRTLIMPTEEYRFVDRITEWVTRKTYKVVGFKHYSIRILRVSMAKLFDIYDDEKPMLFVVGADIEGMR